MRKWKKEIKDRTVIIDLLPVCLSADRERVWMRGIAAMLIIITGIISVLFGRSASDSKYICR